MTARLPDACPCGSTSRYESCCGRYLDASQTAPTAEVLMRSRYTAYALGRDTYLRQTWYPTTRPGSSQLNDDGETKWIGLEVKRHERQDDAHATVEFVARYKVNGRAYRLHELSRFIFENGVWFYLDGEINP